MIFLDKLTAHDNQTAGLIGDARKMRVHTDVIKLAAHLASDEDKLRGAAPYIFFPAFETWLEWSDERGDIGFYFDGRGESVTEGRGLWVMWDRGDDRPTMQLPVHFDLAGYRITAIDPQSLALDKLDKLPPALQEQMRRMAPAGLLNRSNWSMDQHLALQSAADNLRPVIYAILALINSPKVIRSHAVDVSRINKKRLQLGRYPFHPHNEVRLNVDKHIINTVAGHSQGQEGGTRPLHFVRTFLRFRRGQYELVRPHWRGDSEIGIVDTEYRTDRKSSRWKE